MLSITALLFALNAAVPASASFYDHVGRFSPVEATSPAKARFRAARREAMPAPTQAPEYHPDLAMMPILKRAPAGTDTCGFHTDDDIEITCGTTATCTNSGNFRDCCLSTRCATSAFRTTCFDSTATECATTTRPPTGAHCCTFDYAPFCVTYLWSTTASPGNDFTLIACESIKYTGFPRIKAEGPATVDSSTTTSSSRTTSETTTTTSSTRSNGGDSTNTGNGGNGGQTQSSTPSGDSGQSAPVGAIVGGVVGGLAVLALAAVALVFFLRSRKPKEGTPVNTMAAVSPYGSPPPQPMMQNQQTPPPGFPPSQSAYSAAGYTAYNTTPSPGPGSLYPGAAGAPYQPGSPDPSKHYSNVSSEPAYGAYGTSPQPQPPQQYNGYQQPYVAEMGTSNAAGSNANRAELG